jgi:hypothetical protein
MHGVPAPFAATSILDEGLELRLHAEIFSVINDQIREGCWFAL